MRGVRNQLYGSSVRLLIYRTMERYFWGISGQIPGLRKSQISSWPPRSPITRLDITTAPMECAHFFHPSIVKRFGAGDQVTTYSGRGPRGCVQQQLEHTWPLRGRILMG